MKVISLEPFLYSGGGLEYTQNTELEYRIQKNTEALFSGNLMYSGIQNRNTGIMYSIFPGIYLEDEEYRETES